VRSAGSRQGARRSTRCRHFTHPSRSRHPLGKGPGRQGGFWKANERVPRRGGEGERRRLSGAAAARSRRGIGWRRPCRSSRACRFPTLAPAIRRQAAREASAPGPPSQRILTMRHRTMRSEPSAHHGRGATAPRKRSPSLRRYLAAASWRSRQATRRRPRRRLLQPAAPRRPSASLTFRRRPPPFPRRAKTRPMLQPASQEARNPQSPPPPQLMRLPAAMWPLVA